MLIFPITIKAEIRDPIDLVNGIRLRRITENEIYEFFGLKITERDENGFAKGATGPGIKHFFEPLTMAFIMPLWPKIISAQFVFEIENKNCANYLQQALKLHKEGSTGLFIGKDLETHSWICMWPNPYYGSGAYSVDNNDIIEIGTLYERAKAINDKTYDLIIEKFLFALSGQNIREGNRFLELVSILEILYLKGINQELGFRFSLYVSKIFEKYFSRNAKQVFEDAKVIYDIRSDIVHSGFSDRTNEYIKKAIEYTRCSIKLYISEDKSIFENKNLTKIVLEGE